jgi:opacity protein-like surface antigen
VYYEWIPRQKAVKKQLLLGVLCTALVVGAGQSAQAQNGFYGGVSMRDGASSVSGLILGDLPLAWSRFATPVADETNQRSLVFGGYRWRNDVSVEAAINTSNTATADLYALRPSGTSLTATPGVGLTLSDVASRSWNADVYTSWEMIRRLSLYGRVGYAQGDVHPLFSSVSLVQGDPRRQLYGVNYGVGLRYDVTHSLGLRVEYARFGRFAGEIPLSGGMPDSDQLTIGVQFKF